MAGSADEVEEFASTLASDRLIQIYVGGEDEPGSEKPFLVQQSILCDASEYFIKAIKNEHLGSGESGVLRFPADDREVWKNMLYWIMKGNLPKKLDNAANDETVSDLIKLWIQGDKYGLANFQDDVMAELLRSGDLRPWTNLELVVEAFRGTLSTSNLRWMATEQLISGVYVRNAFKYDDIDAFDGIPGAARNIIDVIHCSHEERARSGLEFGSFVPKLPRWNCFMVGDGPWKHWVHDVDVPR